MSCIKHPATVLGNTQRTALASKTRGIANITQQTLQWERIGARVRTDIFIGPNGVGIGHDEFTKDTMQMYRYTLLFLAGKGEQYATKALTLITSWCKGCKSFGGSNAPLETAWGVTSMIRAAELLKYSLKSWKSSDDIIINAFLDKIALPNLLGRYTEIKKWNNNWILSIIECLMQIFLYRDNQDIFLKYIDEYRSMAPTTYVPECPGKNTECDRDYCHAQFQLASHIQICEMAWHQGIKLYTNTLAESCEFIAAVINNNPPTEAKIIKEPYFMPSAWTIALYHFTKRAGTQLHHTSTMLAVPNRRPEGMSFNWGPGWPWS